MDEGVKCGVGGVGVGNPSVKDRGQVSDNI